MIINAMRHNVQGVYKRIAAQMKNITAFFEIRKTKYYIES